MPDKKTPPDEPVKAPDTVPDNVVVTVTYERIAGTLDVSVVADGPVLLHEVLGVLQLAIATVQEGGAA